MIQVRLGIKTAFQAVKCWNARAYVRDRYLVQRRREKKREKKKRKTPVELRFSPRKRYVLVFLLRLPLPLLLDNFVELLFVEF